MSGKTVIIVDELSVAYKSYSKPINFVKELFLGGIRHDTFWALRNISLHIHEGERVGIVGPNGAGKSTLLKAVVGSIAPTSGSIHVDGKISSLLSLVPAWNLDESGVENIEFNLMMRGLDAARIRQIKDEIIEFTDLGPFIYSPVKTYSSGMSARLSFAIATAVDPDILIIDEVLGTGDGYFAGRATKRLQQMCQKGRALLFVSHSTSAVRMMCDRCIWIENGVVRLDGTTEVVLRQYEEDMLRQDEATNREDTRKRQEKLIKLASPEDVSAIDEWRLRIRPAHEGNFTDTHYLRDIRFIVGGLEAAIPLETVGRRPSEGCVAYLDTQSCEWGRLFERRGEKCRILSSRAGMRPGAHICIPRNSNVTEDGVTFELSFLESALVGSESLCVEILDANLGKWLPIPVTTDFAGHWNHYSAKSSLPSNEGLNPEELKDRAQQALRRPVEITKIAVISKNREVISIPEQVPFSIVIDVYHHERMPEVSVNINILRSDGTYVFYQPSGLDDRNIVDHVGRSRVEFNFDENPFAPGDYELNVFVTNGFSWVNCPPTDIFDRSLGWTKFRVDQVRPIPFGLINSIVPVTISTSSASEFSDLQEIEKPLIPLAFPPPYRKMLAFNSDVEWTSWRGQLDLLQIFANRHLETAFSFWFFADPCATWRMFEIDGTPSPHAKPAADLIRAGLLDTLHSYGGVVNGRGTLFNRAVILKAAESFTAMGLTAEVYTNHGGLQDRQNIGGLWCTSLDNEINASNYQLGDVVGSNVYHMDATIGLGIRYFWLDIDALRGPLLKIRLEQKNGENLFVTQTARDGTPMLRFRRSNLGQTPLPTYLGPQIREFLNEGGEGYQIVYNHFGFSRADDGSPCTNPPPYFDSDGYDALDALARAQSEGEVLVTTTKRLLNHALLHQVRPWKITRLGNAVQIQFATEMVHNEVCLPLRWADIEGFAIPGEGLTQVSMVLGDETRPAEFWVVNGVRYAGVKWKPLQMNDALDLVSRYEL